MKRFAYILFLLLAFTALGSLLKAQEIEKMPHPEARPTKDAVMTYVIENGEKIYLEYLRTLYVYPPLVFKNKKQENFYWRTVRDVKIALPYARLASREIYKLNKELLELPDDKARKAHVKKFQKRIFSQYEKPLRDLTINQGKMLIKLIDREHDMNTYEIIEAYKGKVPAMFWNTVAHFFGSDMKAEYDAEDKDKIVERVINLVDAGQL